MPPIQKVSNQTKVSVFEAMMNEHTSIKNHTPEMKNNSPTERTKEIETKAQARRSEWDNTATADGSPKLRHNTPDEIDLMRNSNSIRSARCGQDGITNNGGSRKFVGANKNNATTADVLDRIANSKTSQELISEERAAADRIRQSKQAEYDESRLPRLGETEEAYLSNRGDSVVSNHGHGGKYTAPSGKLSIFDNEDFERLADHKMEIREAKKDDSWKDPKSALTSKQISNSMFDKLASQPEDATRKNLHRDATDRLYEAMINKNNEV